MLVFMIASARALTGGAGKTVRMAARAWSFHLSTTLSLMDEPNESSGWKAPGPIGLTGFGLGGFAPARTEAVVSGPTRATTRSENPPISTALRAGLRIDTRDLSGTARGWRHWAGALGRNADSGF